MEKDKFVWPEGIKKTKLRKKVIEILQNAKFPMSAMEILSAVKEDESPVWISTIYRILEIFAEKDVIIKTSVIENGTAVYELNKHEHTHYAVCIGCHKIIPMENCPIHAFEPKMLENDFHVLGHKLEMYGYCKNCYPN